MPPETCAGLRAGDDDVAQVRIRSPHRPGSARHGHLWRAPDGTGLHAPYGGLTLDEGGERLCCHLCGRWFRALGAHVRVHGHTAVSYREAMGLMRSRALTAADVSRAISRRQTDRYAASEEMRAAFADGHERARAAQEARGESSEPTVRRAPPERVRARREELDRGRATVVARREQQLTARLQAVGALDLGHYLSGVHAAGVSLETMRLVTGLGRDRLRAALDEAGIPARRTGWNSPAGRRSRAVTADAAAAARVGTADLIGWLGIRRDAGWSFAKLGEAVGHSGAWVRTRLAEPANHSGYRWSGVQSAQTPIPVTSIRSTSK